MDYIDNFGFDRLLKLLAVIVLSDGYIHYSKPNVGSIRLETLKEGSEELHELFEKFCLLLFNKLPKRQIRRRFSYNKKEKKNFLITELFLSSAIKELLNLSPDYRTTPPKGVTKNKYLKSPQPTLSFLFNEPENVKMLAFRIWFDCDGSVIPSFKLKCKKEEKNNKIYTYYQIQFECELNIAETNPQLISELIILCKQMGLKAIKKLDKRKWSGYDGIRISEINSIKKFVRHGPMTDIRISRKSKRFYRKSKRAICLGVNDILEDGSIPLSKSFKDKKEAQHYQQLLNDKLIDKIQKHSPVV